MDITKLTDDELWERTTLAAANERAAVCDLVEYLAELDRRNLTTKRGHGSLFDYCVHTLGYSEAAAFRRIRAARAARIIPAITTMLRDGRLNLESIALLHPFLDDPDAEELTKKACGLRLWQLQKLLAGRNPDAPQRDVVRICAPDKSRADAPSPPAEPLLTFIQEKLPPSTTPTAPPVAAPESPPRHTIRVSFSADAEFHELMLRARALLRHKYPDGRLEGVLRDALVSLLERKDRSFGWMKTRRRP